jgi:hypothetical protein
MERGEESDEFGAEGGQLLDLVIELGEGVPQAIFARAAGTSAGGADGEEVGDRSGTGSTWPP